ncbi:F-box protein At1g70590 isoform X2 [Phoenix dactylifera]|uniref:F-box protein At1g70590 isoform X2 n=1 Tax=Phoenix dactylifera TaxID=42345 RepID=A0A8B7MS91_PHODC|nr:F-box protein At1g70590 isoform X2 [Phoenix dactylifera]
MDSTDIAPSSPSAAGLSTLRFRDRRGHPHSFNKKKKPSISSAPKSTHDCRRRDRGGDTFSSTPPRPPASFSDLPFDVLARVAAPFDVPNLWAASMVCRAWRESLRPLREAMILLRWGKRFRHGHGGVRPNPQRALEYFLKGAALGSAPAMVDAGVMYGEMGEKEKAMALYEKAAEVGHPVGQSNLGTCYLEADLPEKAVTWFRQAAESGYARAQYNLALCLHRGRGVECNLQDAAKWYLKAAEGGNIRAMYNTSLCYSLGEGKPRNIPRARMWLKLAADCGHKKAQFEHGLELFIVI